MVGMRLIRGVTLMGPVTRRARPIIIMTGTVIVPAAAAAELTAAAAATALAVAVAVVMPPQAAVATRIAGATAGISPVKGELPMITSVGATFIWVAAVAARIGTAVEAEGS